MASVNITESLLEMHYFRALVTRYRSLLGHAIQVFKPATTSEHWYGFDQAYFTADIPKPEAVEDLRNFIGEGTAPRFTSFRAFLLQFKVVETIQKKSSHSPSGWTTPYFRSELDLEPNRRTGISQHEALHRLSRLAGASVAYVCPMLFEENDVLEAPELLDLRFVDVASSPSGWLTTDRHFLAFQDPTSTPTWCSVSVPGKALTLEQVFQRAKPMRTEGLFELLASLRRILMPGPRDEAQQDFLEASGPNILPPCLSIVAELLHEK